jgi:hypothetical protein
MKVNKSIILQYLLAIIFFLIGVAGAVLLVYRIKPEKSNEMASSQSKRDTVFVKLVDQQLSFIPSATTGTKLVDSTTNFSSPNYYSGPRSYFPSSAQSVALRPQTGRILTSNNPAPVADAITATGSQNATDLNGKYVVRKISSFETLFGFGAAMVILLSAFLTNDEEVQNAQIGDVDPDDIQKLFKEFRDSINLLRNPRKILRFKNNAKYHYYFLRKNGITDMESLRKMMWLLFAILDDSSLIDIQGIAPEALSDANWFYEKLKMTKWFKQAKIEPVKDGELMMIVLKLNVDMGA